MDSSNVKEIISCGICLETFNGDTRCPRMMICGHSFCQACLEKLIGQNPCCPTCKMAVEIPINFAPKSETGFELSKTINEQEKLVEEQKAEIQNNHSLIDLPLTLEFKDLLSKFNKSSELPRTAFLTQLENWCTTGSVFVQEDRFDGTKYGEVTLNYNYGCCFFIHNFHPVKPKGHLIQFKELLSNINGSSDLPSTAFIRFQRITQFGMGEVDVQIKTDGASPQAKNFLLLCSGLKGSTYKGLTMHFRSDCCILDSGPAPVVEGIGRNGARVTCMEAGVYGMSEGDSGFWIQLRDKSKVYSWEIGSVVAGLQDLFFHNEFALISDCGFVI